ncbi:MAG: D-alanyl-D-alanine carboxypeptidase [Clostridia bacterium]|nr:D-alanyl-D-alanine carboxypeptidase [Clostridia bacterium]
MPHKTRFFCTVLCLLALLIPFFTLSVTATGAGSAMPLDTASFQVLPESTATVTAAPGTSAASFALLDPVSGRFIAEGDADTRRPMASTTKIMTALVVLETLPLDEMVTVDAAAVGTEGSSIYLFTGEQITVRTLLYALMLSSANDAAAALAIHTAGSIESFAALMNQRAAKMGLTNTHFCNPHGLHDESHYTTARELALLTAEALRNETFAEIVSTQRYSAPQIGTDASRLFLNHNRLLRSFEGTVGVKTGFTKNSGRCLVSAAKRDGLTLIAVTLQDPNDWRDHTALLEWGFSQYEAFATDDAYRTLPVVGGTAGEIRLVPRETARMTLPATHAEITCTVEMPRFLFGGFGAGETKGRLIYRMGDEVLCEIPLVTADAVSAEQARLTLLDRIKNLFRK